MKMAPAAATVEAISDGTVCLSEVRGDSLVDNSVEADLRVVLDVVRPVFALVVADRSGDIEAVGVHHLGPHRDKILHEFLRIVVLSIDLGISAQD